MPISVECEGCGKNYKLGDDKAGKKFKCKECDAVVSIPEDDEEFADAFEVVEEDEDDDDDHEERPRRQSAGKRGGKRRGGRERAQSSRRKGSGRSRDDADDDGEDDRGKKKSGGGKGKLIGRIVLYSVLGIALIVVGLDYMEQQKMVKSQDAIVALMDAANRSPIKLEAAEEKIVGSPKREEEAGRITFTWGLIRSHKLVLVTRKFINDVEVQGINPSE